MPEPASQTERRPGKVFRTVEGVGAAFTGNVEYVGGLSNLFHEVSGWLIRSLTVKGVRFGTQAMIQQLVRVGVMSTGIIVLVSSCIGLIMVLQMAPPLETYGARSTVANINAVAILRELGPLISAIVLTGFAGASIAAELGTMVVGEEIEAMESMALNPVRFLVLPRVVATVIGLVVLAVIADFVALFAGAAMGILVLEIPAGIYYSNTLEQAKLFDFSTGILKAAVFGLLIGLIACYNGLKVSGGAAGVGKATTTTVVHSIVSIILADLVFTALFYVLGWT